MVKREKKPYYLPPKRDSIYLTIKTLGSKKRKSVGAPDIGLKNLGVEEALLKLIFFSQSVSTFELLSVLLQFNYHDLLLVFYHVSRSTKDLRIEVERVEHALKEKEGIKRDLMQRVEKLSKEKIER